MPESSVPFLTSDLLNLTVTKLRIFKWFNLKTLGHKLVSAPSRQVFQGACRNVDGMKGKILIILFQAIGQIMKVNVTSIPHYFPRFVRSLTNTNAFDYHLVGCVEGNSALLASLDTFGAILMVISVDQVKLFPRYSIRV